MTCLHPIFVRAAGAEGGFFAPCGKCVPCRVARAREWATRIICEQDYWRQSFFLTLTYDEEHLVRGYQGHGHLMKSHLQVFFRECRRDFKLRYFACGEYGETYGRPHYHAIVFCNTEPDWQYYWPHGEVDIGTVTYDSARYTADYVLKSYADPEFESLSRYLPCPFVISSGGIGKQWALDHADDIRRCGISIYIRNGIKVGVPRYFRKVLGITTDEFRSAIADEHKAKEVIDFWRHRPEAFAPSGVSKTNYIRKYVLQRARIDSARALESSRKLRDSSL